MTLECKQLEIFQANQLSVHLCTIENCTRGRTNSNIVPSVFTLLIKNFQDVILKALKQYDGFIQM